MSQPTWDPDKRRWLLDDEDAPAPRRNRRRAVDVIDRPGTDQDTGGTDAGERTGAPSLGAELTRVGFGAREPRPGDRDRTGRGGPDRPSRDRRPADQDRPPPADDQWRGTDRRGNDLPADPSGPWTRRDGGWALLDPVHPDPLAPGAAGRDAGDPYSDVDGRDPRRGGHRPGGDRSDAPEPFRPGGFDRTWRDGLAGSGVDTDDDRGGRYGPDGFGRASSDEAPDRIDRSRRRPDGWTRDEAFRADVVGRRAAPGPGPIDPNRPVPGHRPRPAYGPDGYGAHDPARGGVVPDAASRAEATGRRAAPPRPGPGGAPDANGYDPRARTDVGRGRGPENHRPYGDAGPDVAHGRYAHAPGHGPDRTGRHGEVAPGGFGPEQFDADGYNLDGLGRDGFDRDGFDVYGFDREGFDREGFDREGFDRDGYHAETYEVDEYDQAYDPPYDDGPGYGYADGYGPDGYHRPGRRRAYEDGAHRDGGYDEDDYDPDNEGTLTDGEIPAVEEDQERSSRSRRGTGTKRRRWPWVVGAAAVAGAVAVPVGMSLLGSGDDSDNGTSDPPLLSGSSGTAGLGASGAAQQAPPGAAQPAGPQVTYELNGPGKVDSITFGRGTAYVQEQGAQLPWKQSSPAAQGPSDYTLSAVSGDGGEMSCRISVDGAVIAEQSGKAAVSCNGRR